MTTKVVLPESLLCWQKEKDYCASRPGFPGILRCNVQLAQGDIGVGWLGSHGLFLSKMVFRFVRRSASLLAGPRLQADEGKKKKPGANVRKTRRALKRAIMSSFLGTAKRHQPKTKHYLRCFFLDICWLQAF